MSILIIPAQYNYINRIAVVARTILMNRNQKIIFFGPDENDTWNRVKIFENKINELCEKNNCTIEFWEGNFQNIERYQSNRIKVINWSTSLATMCLQYKFKEQHNLKHTKLLVSLNRSALPHKCNFIDLLSQYNLISNNIVSWHGRDYKGYKFEYFNNKKIILDEFTNPYTYPPQYHLGFFDVICESFADTPDISEKTFKAIAAKKPFISVGYKGFYKQLEKLGFQLYTEIFNYSFDNFETFHLRAEAVIQQIKNYENSNLEELRCKIESKIEHNYNQFLEIAHSVPEEFIEIAKNYNIHNYNVIFNYFNSMDRHNKINLL